MRNRKHTALQKPESVCRTQTVSGKSCFQQQLYWQCWRPTYQYD